MRRLLVVALLALAVDQLTGGAAHAQIAGAIGKPLESPDLAAGEVSIKVVAGSPSNLVKGTDVTLVVNGAMRVARTDEGGRAVFKDLPPGATVQAKVSDEDKKESTSEEFQLPADKGVRLLLSTKPWNPGAGGGGGGGAPFAGGGAPEPRQMSGEPRAEQADSPGSVTVRLTYDDFKDAPPVGVAVTLVGYSADDRVTVETKPTDKDGRASFVDLDRTGATSYFAMAQLPRNGAIDRLMSTPATLDARGGVRMILSSLKRTATDLPIDDIVRLEKQDQPTPAGKIRVALEGGVEQGVATTLVDAATQKVIATGQPEIAPPDPSNVQASAQYDAKPDVPSGTLDVQVHGGAGQTDEALGDVTIRILPITGKLPNGMPQTDEARAIESKTSATGQVRIAIDPSLAKQFLATITVNGKPLSSKPFELQKTGGVLDVEAHWEATGRPQVMFDVTPSPDQVFYVETRMHGNLYRSIAFQAVAGHGTRVSLFIYPRLLFSFSLTSHLDDAYLAVSGRFDVSNNAWAPYRGGPDGLVIPLPKEFKGALVAEMDQGDVSVAQGEGFRIARPIPPGDRQFHGAFSLPVRGGDVRWDLDLPFGAYQSGMEILHVPGMSVQTPPGVSGQTMTVPQGTFFVLPQISILPRQSMVMTIQGLPSQPAWRVWLPRFVAILAIGLMLGGLGIALFGGASAATERAARRAKLLDELVELEKTGKNEKRREAVLAELEQLWG